ncbi:hypothetical protein AMES_4756 [Amycolatopsis mediterranei S699]|uniref:Uncharacterized protein n=2 Tax=Amycolatopsis mediterranei TaxID=33910 RepID=A0A0H3D7D5_AMYMU|nr:hypothetical protein [Amycolatopsis mediterranei]ADJ46581.1 hypothetical protein AMED_4815 [Amycolatopsis mediterranei U32]AEK43382.1 hypothetical protein RAM_24510 [Amycolatopsis mediterranei S699]AFO78292.1 hypothetical protein AMES_4756 [Amycolatopsis mediterranei S699]AGT85420.1 hypothetical protein B737_4756 [Amycolatopsis mediterranei RB]KDO11516.1 hypothetical protein DV26_08205 [Amycolatopsis mediterranei]
MTGRAWPFLIARGRRRGYSALLVPGFLREHGFLEATATPLDDVPSRAAATPHGVLVWAEHTVTAAEARGEPRDEYGRPLVLLHGFLCPDGDPAPAAAALTRTRTTALAVYDRFLADEEGFRTERSEPFAIEVTEITEVVRPRVSPPDTPVRPVRGLAWAGAGVLVVAAAVAAVVGFASAGNDAPPPPECGPDVVAPSVAPAVSAATCVRGGTTVTYSAPPSRHPA